MFNIAVLVKELTVEIQEYMGSKKFENERAAYSEAAYMAYAWVQQKIGQGNSEAVLQYAQTIGKADLNEWELEIAVINHLESQLRLAYRALVVEQKEVV